MQITATEAKNRFGYYCAQAKARPVFVEKSGRIDTVILSFDDYARANFVETPVEQQVSPEAQRFYEENKDWIDRQNEIVEKHGIWSDGLVDWQHDPANPKHRALRAGLQED